MSHDCDLLIVGTGVAGLALAASLADTKYTVRVVSHHPAAHAPSPGEPPRLRVSTINAGIVRALQRLGVWGRLDATRLGRVQRMAVWRSSPRTELVYDSAGIGEPLLGVVVENDALVAALLERCRAAANIQLMSGAALAALDPQADAVGAAFDATPPVMARLVVGADGAQSAVRQLGDIPAYHYDYRQTAVVTNITTRKPHRDTAYQRFLATGPLALLPLPGPRSALVWSTSAEQAATLCALDPARFAALLETETQGRLGTVTVAGPCASFPLRLITASRYGGDRVVLVGDAAHVVHPLAGLGANLALTDAFALAEVILDAAGDPGAARVLRRYERWRKSENAPVTGVIHLLDRLFRGRAAGLGLVRDGSLDLANRLPPLKTFLMGRASGVAGDLPRVMRQPL